MLGFIEKINNNFATTTGTWCNFLLSNKVHKIVGDFDERFFPAYYEDNDYHQRLKLDLFKVEQHEFMNPEIYRNSMTIEKNRSLNSRFEINKQYYIEKWGGVPGEEKFSIPFNDLFHK